MAVREKGDVAIRQRGAVDRGAGSRGYLFDRLRAGKAFDPKIPARNLFANIRGRETFVITVIPLEEVGLDLRHIAVSGQAAGLQSTLERAGQHQGETFTAQAPRDRGRLLASGF